MITIGKHKLRSYMVLEHKFMGVRLIDKELSPVEWNLSIVLAPSQKKRVSKESIARNTEITYQRLQFWLDTNLSNIIAVSSQNATGIAIATTASNVMMVCPEEPFDELIVELLHNKLTALAAGHLIVGDVSIKSSDTNATFVYDCPDGEYNLPLLVSEYINAISLHKLPWWARNDGFCFELLKPDSCKDKTNEEFFGDILQRDPMLQFESALEELDEDYLSEALAPVIQVEKWKPQKV